MAKIALIKPPARGLADQLAYPPMGLLYLASNIHGSHEIRVYNMEKTGERIKYDADVYGIGVHSVSSVDAAKAVSKRIRKNTAAPVVWGGGFPTSMVDYSLEHADYVIRGEGEFAWNFCVNNGFPKTERVIDGGIIENLDSLAFPARHLLPRNHIRHEGRVHHTDKPSTTLFCTRGCFRDCAFCDRNISSRKWRHRSVENIVKEIKQIQAEYDIHWFRFPDDNLTLNRKWFGELCIALTPLDIEWTCLSRGDSLDLELLDVARNAGLREVFFGIESGSQRMLDLMNKQITVRENTEAIELCRRAGVVSCAYMMFGFPGEDRESVELTKQWLLDVRPDKSRVSTFVPIPGTDVWNNPQKYGVRVKPNFEDFWYFDDPVSHKLYDFGLEYDYIGNDVMAELRLDVLDFYRREGFLVGWVK
jgi:radical SAM superfamily enzyme YgiQ (UPF0313 family)